MIICYELEYNGHWNNCRARAALTNYTRGEMMMQRMQPYPSPSRDSSGRSFSHRLGVPLCPGSPSHRHFVFPYNFYYTIPRELFRFCWPINSIVAMHIQCTLSTSMLRQRSLLFLFQKCNLMDAIRLRLLRKFESLALTFLSQANDIFNPNLEKCTGKYVWCVAFLAVVILRSHKLFSQVSTPSTTMLWTSSWSL